MNPEEITKAEKTKKYIIRKTAPIFNKKGYAGTSISDLTEATGLTKGSIYGNFENKDEVALCAFRHNAESIIRIIDNEITRATAFIDKLLVYPRLYSNIASHIISFGGCPILNTLVESDDTHAELRKEALKIITMWKKMIVSLIGQGKEAGEIRDDADPEKTAEFMISIVEGSVGMTKATGQVSFVMHSMEYLEKAILELRA